MKKGSRSGIALYELIMTIAVISLITVAGLFVYRSILLTLSLNNEAELLHHYLKNAQNSADIYQRSIKWEALADKYKIIDLEENTILKERRVPKHIKVQGESLVFNSQIRPEQGRTITLTSGKKIRKITIDPSTGRVRLW
jgi:Tfp pilus assembly protein FimT